MFGIINGLAGRTYRKTVDWFYHLQRSVVQMIAGQIEDAQMRHWLQQSHRHRTHVGQSERAQAGQQLREQPSSECGEGGVVGEGGGWCLLAMTATSTGKLQRNCVFVRVSAAKEINYFISFCITSANMISFGTGVCIQNSLASRFVL